MEQENNAQQNANLQEEVVDRVLVQGTVTFTVNCNVLKAVMKPEQVMDEEFLKGFFEDKAFKMIDLSSCDVDIDYERPVRIAQSLADKHTDEIVSDNEWKALISNDVQNR